MRYPAWASMYGSTHMKCSDAGLELIQQFEGCRLESYRDSVGVLTIGYGHTLGVHEGMVIDQIEADRLLHADLVSVEKCIMNSVTGALTQSQFDALCSWVFNLGCGALRNSTLLRCINSGDDEKAATEILKWDHAGGKVLAGLTRRRQAESEMFLA